MAYHTPRDLDGFMPHLLKADTKFRQQVGADLLAFLAEPANSIICQDIGQLVDGLIPWMQSSNFKVSSNGIEIMTNLVDRLGYDFRPYLQTVLPCVIERLSDSHDIVRENAQLIILKLLEREVLTPQHLLDKLTPCFTHKNAKIREEVLRCLVNTLNEHGAHSVTLSKFIPHIVKLLSDPASAVRDTAYSTLVDLYKHVGEKLRADLQRRNLVPAAKLPALWARFDEVLSDGKLLPSATAAASGSGLDLDEIDRVERVMAAPKPIIPVKKPGLGSAVKKSVSTTKGVMQVPSMPNNPASVTRVGSIRKTNSATASGAVDEDTFIKSFEDVPTMQLFSSREVNEHMKNVQDIIGDTGKDWNKRVDALKKLRSLIIAGAPNFDDFLVNLRNLELPLQVTIRDLRSQVVREACITIAYLSMNLGSKFDHAAEQLLHPLINLIQNSAKIMATAGVVTVRIIIQNTHSPRLIPIITTNLINSKSKEIRRSCCELLDLLMNQWPTHPLERHIAILQDSIKKGIADADPDARVSARKAFRGFKDHFPDQAENLLQSLEPSYRKALQGELSSSSSSGSLAQMGYRAAPRPIRAAPVTLQPTTGSVENLSSGCVQLQRVPSLPRSYTRQRSGIPVLSNSGGKKGFRSNSAIDLQAAQRAKARSQYSQMARQKIASGTASLQGEVAQQARPRKSPVTPSMQSPERLGRSRRSRSVGISHSQPTSRSGSPSSRLPYLYGRAGGGGGGCESDSPRPRRLSSGIPRSTQGSRDTSRETSPTRGNGGTLGRYRRYVDRPPMSPALRPPVLAQRILQQSREAESALADALVFDSPTDVADYHRLSSPRKTMRSIDNHSDDSETSSVCSERSFESYNRRHSNSYSWSGSQHRLTNRDIWEPCHDINEIIALCASTIWQERKDGLVSLRYYLNSGALLTPGELTHITEIFTKMFMDSHTKGLSVFLDTVNELIRRYKQDLHEWLYVLLQRMFYKLGTDLLMSAQSKLLNTLENVRKSFPTHLQFSSVYRFVADVAQTPNSKVKVAVLTYLTALCNTTEPAQFVSKPPAKQALMKIINYAQDAKSIDIRNAAKICIVALWNCNTAEVTMMLAELPKEQQDVASTIVHSHMRRSSSGSEPGSPQLAKPLLSPIITPLINRHTNDLMQEEIYNSLRKTTAEIQNYSYETLGSILHGDRDTTSQDSGISQMSLGDMVRNDLNAAVDERMELRIPASRLTYAAPNGLRANDSNGYGHIEHLDAEELVNKILECCVPKNPIPTSEKCKLIEALITVIKEGNIESVIQNFMKLLRIIIENLNDEESKTKVVILQLLRSIFKNKDLEESWRSFIELLTLRIMHAHTDEVRDVVKHAESTAAAMMAVCPFNTVVQNLSSLVQTAEYPDFHGAIKMLTKLIEMHPNEVTDDHLAAIMPGITKRNEHDQSSVRKSAVFCIVAIHKAVGEDRLSPYITLTGSKLKLLRLYISKAQQSS